MTITVANGITTYDFTTNTSASYTSGHTDGVSNGTWTFDLANNRLVATGGSASCYFNSSISLWNSWAEVDMDQSEGGGIQVMRSGTDSCYNLYINDASSASNPNTIQLYGMPGY